MSRSGRVPLVLALLLLAVVAGPVTAASAQSAAASDVRGAQVVVVGAPGLRWSDVTPAGTPALHGLASRSAVGALSVKARPEVSCPADGWLTLGAGARAEAFGVPCGELSGERAALQAANQSTRDAADVDALQDALSQAGACLSARGPGSRLAGGRAQPVAAGANQGGASTGEPCPALLLDAPPVGGDDDARAAGAAAVDALVAAVDSARDQGSTLLVVGLSQVPGDGEAQLQLALASGPSFPGGGLRSASTRRAPYVQLVDVAPTLLGLLEVPVPAEMTGQPWHPAGRTPAIAALVDLEQRAVEAKRAQVPFLAVLVGGLLLGLVVAAALRSWRVAEAVGLAGVAAVAGSSLAGLVPWWRAPFPLLALVGATALVVALTVPAARALAGPVAPATAVCGGLAVLLVVDLLTGAGLQMDTPVGYSPLVAGRFAGIGNVGFGVLASAVLLALAGLTHGRPPRPALLVTAGGGLLAVVVVGAPPWGSDVGGVLALLPGVALLAMLRTGTRVTAARLLLSGLAALLLVAAFAVADFRRDPLDRTHLGRFAEQVVDGTAGSVLRRKAEAIVDLLLANPVTALLPVVVALAVLLVVRPPPPLRRGFEAVPAWRHGVLAVGATSAVGFAVNDSGPAVPALALLVAVPATIAVVARVAARRPPAGPADP